MTDQASGLRRVSNPHPVRVIAVTGGKGGVGKTNVAVNMAVASAIEGKKVMLMDADLGLANVDVLLGLHPKQNLSHVIEGKATLEEIILQGPAGVMVVPASSGVKAMAQLNPAQHAGLIRAFSELSHQVDVLYIDTAAGISDMVMNFAIAAQELIVVVCDEPASITDAYAQIKVMNRDYGINRVHVLANMAHSVQEGRELFNKIAKVTDKYLDIAISYLGVVPYDDSLKRAVQKQRAVVEAFPRSKSSIAFKNLVQKTDNWPMPRLAGGHLEFFVERLVLASQQQGGVSL